MPEDIVFSWTGSARAREASTNPWLAKPAWARIAGLGRAALSSTSPPATEQHWVLLQEPPEVGSTYPLRGVAALPGCAGGFHLGGLPAPHLGRTDNRVVRRGGSSADRRPRSLPAARRTQPRRAGSYLCSWSLAAGRDRGGHPSAEDGGSLRARHSRKTVAAGDSAFPPLYARLSLGRPALPCPFCRG